VAHRQIVIVDDIPAAGYRRNVVGERATRATLTGKPRNRGISAGVLGLGALGALICGYGAAMPGDRRAKQQSVLIDHDELGRSLAPCVSVRQGDV
jgi:hypothetical protein